MVNQQDMKQQGRRVVTFEPMDKRQCKYFPGAYITASSRCKFPGIPMDHPALYDVEKKNRVMLESLKLTFELPEGKRYDSRLCGSRTKVQQMHISSTSFTSKN